LDKPKFIGRDVLVKQKTGGVQRRCVAFKSTEKTAPPRPQYAIWSVGPDAVKIGEVTSGTQSPTFGIGIGMGYLAADFAQPGTPIAIEVRGRKGAAVVVPKPIYRKI
jgi:aminomethyltransferase